MLNMLSNIGRASIVLGALGMAFSGACYGYILVRASEPMGMLIQGGQITPGEALGICVGGLLGMVGAGCIFGAMATLYLILDALRARAA